MAIGATMVWRVRVSGNELNGGGYDAQVSGAGTDYTDQDSPQLSITDAVTNGTTTVTSVTGGFTTAMIGNVIRIAGDGYYVITARASTNSITVDRATGTSGASNARVGGAHASLASYANGGTLTQPILATPLAAGHTVYMRGSGTDTPSSADYDFSAGYWTFPNGDATNGYIRITSYNGRARIHYCGLIFNGTQYVHITGFFFYQSAASFVSYGVFGNSANYSNLVDCVIDAGGIEATLLTLGAGMAYKCRFINPQGGTAGATYPGVALAGALVGGLVLGCVIDGLRGYGVGSIAFSGSVIDTIIVNCKGNGIHNDSNNGYPDLIKNCTIDANLGHGIALAATSAIRIRIINNIISNHVGSGKYGIYSPDTIALHRRLLQLADYNDFYGNTDNFSGFELQTHDQQVDPSYVNPAGGNYMPTGDI